MSKRRPISLKTKLASALCQMMRDDGTGKLVRIVSYDDAKKMTADQVISLVHFHHIVLHAHGGSDEHWNLEPKPIREHQRETAERDIPAAAKVVRLTDKQQEFRRRLLAKAPGEKRQLSRKIPSRPFQKKRRSA